MMSYQEVEQAMDQFVDAAFFRQPFFQDLQAGRWSRGFLQYFAAQYAHYSAHFPRILGAAIAAMEPDERWWLPLADNLWDEAGRGVPGQSHAQLYQTFLHSVAPELGALPAPSPSVLRTVDGSLALLRVATPLEAMSAIGLGSEYFAGRVMGTIAQGLRHPAYQVGGKVDTRFWDLHARRDEPRHYALCRKVLETVRDSQRLKRLVEVGQAFGQLEAEMYAGLYQEYDA
jgi:pyrroloquinoline quinone (PQQ) biosynthesis protein C